MIRVLYKFLSSSQLALVLLVIILACCIAGVTIWRGEEAGRVIFGTLWFNGLLVLLVVNIACCFFPRMWGRKLTLISTGMVLFHLSFVAMLGGVVFNSLFYFRGVIRLSEGEILPSGDPASYDYFDHGRYFSLSKLKGETELIKMHTDYSIEGQNKWAAYEISVGERNLKKRGIMYITRSFEYLGFNYLNDREGYSLVLMLRDRSGKELYGVCAPIQSLKQKDGSYIYTTGTSLAPGSYPFPQPPAEPLFNLRVTYFPSNLQDRGGKVLFRISSLHDEEEAGESKAIAEGNAAVGEWFAAGGYKISVTEVRYWVGMNIHYEPGQPIVLTSLWVGLGGMIMTFIGRMRRSNI